MTSNVPRSGTHTESLVLRTTCRNCSGQNLVEFLSLGEVPLANAFAKEPDVAKSEPRFPLKVFLCTDCFLVQLLHIVQREVLFSNYLYRTGTNKTIAAHNTALAESVASQLGLKAGDLVVEIASNDGSLLQCFQALGMNVLGVEPASNLVDIAQEAGIDSVNEFFEMQTARACAREYGLAKVIVANNVLAHVDETVEFLQAAKHLLHESGRVVIEVPYLGDLLERLEYDTIYHEHLCYFSVIALLGLFENAGLAIDVIERIGIHGGSLRIWARHDEGQGHSQCPRDMAAAEVAAGLASLAPYERFATKVEELRHTLQELLQKLIEDGASICGYGAPAKGNTMLCYCGIGTETLPYTVDMSPLKVGLYTPGTSIPILPVHRILENQPDYVLILAWNFAPEIMEFLSAYRERGGNFIIPLPKPFIV